MLFSKITLLSLVAIATALPNAIPEPEPEPAQLEARTWNWKWNYNKCECDCPYQNYKRDENGLEARTLWLLPNFWDKNSCQHGCDNYCKDAYKSISHLEPFATAIKRRCYEFLLILLGASQSRKRSARTMQRTPTNIARSSARTVATTSASQPTLMNPAARTSGKLSL